MSDKEEGELENYIVRMERFLGVPTSSVIAPHILKCDLNLARALHTELTSIKERLDRLEQVQVHEHTVGHKLRISPGDDCFCGSDNCEVCAECDYENHD